MKQRLLSGPVLLFVSAAIAARRSCADNGAVARAWGMAAKAVCVGALSLAGCGGSSGNFARTLRRCVGNGGYSSVSQPADVAFALEDARQGRVEVEYGAGQMRGGDETDFAFAVPSRRAPRYVIAAIVNQITTLPESRREDLASFAVALKHPERFDAVMLSRAPSAKAFLERLDNCVADQIQMEGD
jgi:hypothetical protein